MPTPYPVTFKKPLEYLSVQDWNNFVNNLLFINQYGSAKLLQYYQNDNFQNLNDVFSKVLSVAELKVNGFNVLHNLSAPEAYTFPYVFETMIKTAYVLNQWQNLLNKLNSVKFQFPYFKTVNYNFIFQNVTLQKKIYQLVPNIVAKITSPSYIAGTQFMFSGSQNLKQIIDNYINPLYYSQVREILIQNLGGNPVQINNSLYLMPGKILKVTISNPSELNLYAQSPTLLSALVSFSGIPEVLYAITITNNQSDPTPTNFQQLLNLNLQGIISSSSQLLNLQFCQDINCKSPLYAWISEYSSDLSSVYIWVNLPSGIPANSSITIYMKVTKSIQYPYTGINAYYNYQYDNGSYVFDAYINAMGSQIVASGQLQIYSNVYSTIQFTPQSGSTPGYILMLNGQGGSYTAIYLNSSNANNTNEVFESVEYYNGGADEQAILFLGSASFCNTYTHGNNIFFSNGYAVSWDPYTSQSYIWSGCNIETAGGENFTSSGYNFYQAIVTSSEIIYNGSQISTPLIESPQISLTQEDTWSATISPGGSAFGIMDSSGGVSHTGYFYWARARKLPPNNTMPSNSQPTKIIIYA
ncbi:hypothetical protein N617_gp28 [Stygiolobus rod-shaped virus]|uniref:DUF2341 domain-containing protein n=1 Tax=Stygiolobus rod-shaped virus TaxID=537009 RepID=B6EFD4_9VIRU|nr:hypothetical protein N617_gp28 [Stygiolobus rod-shaped virus]CAQ58469.1 hypothetical protein [Stygiolobus rod-shaped virus]